MLLKENRRSWEQLQRCDDLSVDERNAILCVKSKHDEESLKSYFQGCCSMRQELAEVLEMKSLLHNVLASCARIVDIGCSHGRTSLLLSSLLDHSVQLVWVDRDANCTAARYAQSMKAQMLSSIDLVPVLTSSLVLCVHLCGEAMQQAMLSPACQEAQVVLCIPCCPPKHCDINYVRWVDEIARTMDKDNNVLRIPMKSIKNRTALLKVR